MRLRLSQAEVAAIGEGGDVAADTRFPDGGAFRYRVGVSTAVDSPEASFADGCLSVRLPASAARRWAGSDEEVSIRAEQPLGDETALRILVEKDFACLAPREDEDESDLFPHPEAGRRC